MSEQGPAHQGIPSEPNASDRPHDVLAAEEFAMPAPEAAWHDRPLRLPPDPSGIEEPHDVLAAEEFAMPAPPPRAAFERPSPSPGPSRRGLAGAVAAAGALLGALALRRRRRA
jgi:hypothetical protein